MNLRMRKTLFLCTMVTLLALSILFVAMGTKPAPAIAQADTTFFLPLVAKGAAGTIPGQAEHASGIDSQTGDSAAADKNEMPPDVDITLTGDDFNDTIFVVAPSVHAAYFVDCVSNPYYPLPPGRVWNYEMETADGLETTMVTVTNQTKEVLGVTTTVVRDTVLLEGELVEDTFDWYAQDIRGHVWYFGEDVRNYEDGQLVDNAGSWEAGVDGAVPGIIMLNQPLPGDIYRQEYWQGEAEDMAGVLQLAASVSVPYDKFRGVLVTADYNPLEDTLENKYYARGIGLVKEEDLASGDIAELISVHNERLDEGDNPRCQSNDDDDDDDNDDDRAK